MTSYQTGRWSSLPIAMRIQQLQAVAMVFVVVGGVCCNAASDMFTALVDVQRALEDEMSAADLLRNLIRIERARFDQLEQLANEWENHSKTALSDIERHVYHPVNFFLLAKYYAITWKRMVDQLSAKSSTEEFLYQLPFTTTNFPDHRAYEMSASALLRLQDVYRIETDIISRGLIGDNSSPPMSADDCFQLGKVAYENNDFYHAVTWLSEAIRIGDMETTKTTSKAMVLDYLSYAMFKQGNVRHAHNLTLEWLQLEPNHERANNNLNHYRRMLHEEEEKFRLERQVLVVEEKVKNVRILDSFRDTPEFDAYERLCRGENAPILVDAPQRPLLTCQYRRHVPMFFIRPLKEELLSLQPRIVVYHDVLTDSEIAKIKELSIPKLHRSGVFALKNSGDTHSPGYTDYRTSKSAWLNDAEDPLIAKVSRKAAALSNLTLNTVEDLQVLNYGIGGHYEPHFDFSRADEVAQFSEEQGNRIATIVFYLNDVHYGGYTVFNVLGLSVPAIKGSCLLWYNLLSSGDGDYRTRHAGCPVLVGTKWVANKWFHVGGQEFSRPCNLRPHTTE